MTSDDRKVKKLRKKLGHRMHKANKTRAKLEALVATRGAQGDNSSLGHAASS